jgi:V8-like Glu-specific endopeptidase
MRRSRHARLVLTGAVLTALLIVPLAAAPTLAADPAQAAHDRTVAYWTPARIASAVPRDFVRDATGALHRAPLAKPGGGHGGPKPPPTGTPGNNVTGASWTFGGQVLHTTGKVLFTLNSGNYICSGTVVVDARTGFSTVLSAGHCAYDKNDGGFARNWMFIPEFDTNPTYTCSQSRWGCWTAAALVIHNGFFTAGSFNQQATTHDWSFAVVGAGGKSNTQLDTTVGSFGLSISNLSTGGQVFAFGYPAAGKYHGSDLTFCSDQVFSDTLNSGLTWGIDCDMTGGSSGGPWLTSFNTTTGVGTLSSLNSYGYSGITAMFGPKFNAQTQTTLNLALSTTSGNVVAN